MIQDAALRLSANQAVTTTAASTNVIDLGATPPDLGGGANVFAVATVSEAFATCTSVKVSLQDSADNSTFADIASGPVIAVADLVVGKDVMLAVPQGHRRYLRLNYTVAGSAATAGKFNAVLTPNPATA